MTLEEAVERVRAAVEQHGLLLMQDAKLPSLVAIVATGPIKGSWWSHPQSALMFDVLQVIHEETLVVKLLSGKRTFVHSRLWPAVCAIAESNEPWQLDGLPTDAREVLDRVRVEGSIRSDHIELPATNRKLAAIADELEKRLLVHATDEHTERGHHARALQTWAHWRAQAKLSARSLPTVESARELIETATARYSAPEPIQRLLPWLKVSPPKRRR